VTALPERDRDDTGRARNARRRDDLGRPLPRGAAGHLPYDGPALPPDETLDLAQQLLDSGRPFTAHEVLEAAWKEAPEPEVELWRGLAQLCVGATHSRRGNATGARALLERASAALAGYEPAPPHRIDVAALRAWVAAALTGGADMGRPPPLRTAS
jgi:uncharacterized protein